MQLAKILTSEALVVPLEDLKLDLRVDSDDEDATIVRIAQGAAGFMERRTGFAIQPGTYEALLSEWPHLLEIKVAPLRELDEIAYLTAKDEWTPVDLADWQVSRRGRSFVIHTLSTFSAPTLFSCVDSIRVEFDAGYDVDDTGLSGESFAIPPLLRTALIAMCAEAYANREIAKQNLGMMDTKWSSILESVRQYW